MLLQDGFDLGCGDILARAPDNVFHPINEMKHPIGILGDGVADMEPPIPPRQFRFLLVLQITGKKPFRESGPANRTTSSPSSSVATSMPVESTTRA